jgi:5'-deoxynucleotidase YfbR-like HD superfamily hydrolase
MTETITDLYDRMTILPNIRDHMLRVAGVAALIMDRWAGPGVDRNRVLRVCLTHDLGNIVKCHFDNPQQFKLLGDEVYRRDYWKDIQKSYLDRFGRDDEQANQALALEAGMSAPELDLLREMDFRYEPETVASHDYARKIIAYADRRVGPFGVVTLQGRIDDARERYGRNTLLDSMEWVTNVFRLEEQIFRFCRLYPDDIHDNSVAPYIEKLRNFTWC